MAVNSLHGLEPFLYPVPITLNVLGVNPCCIVDKLYGGPVDRRVRATVREQNCVRFEQGERGGGGGGGGV